MKTLKQRYEQIISNTITESNRFKINDFDNENPNLSSKERNNIMKKIVHSKILNGNQKVDKINEGLSELGDILYSCGFNLQMVSGDMLRDVNKGTLMLSFSRKTDNQFVEGVEIENCQVRFAYENLAMDDKKSKYEILAYLT